MFVSEAAEKVTTGPPAAVVSAVVPTQFIVAPLSIVRLPVPEMIPVVPVQLNALPEMIL